MSPDFQLYGDHDDTYPSGGCGGLIVVNTIGRIGCLTHQIGGFFGAWLGGLAMAHAGNYLWMWYADMLLALLAAVVNLPIREAKVR